MTTIYRGEGGSFAPYAPALDALMGKRMQLRGLSGTRDSAKALFGSTSKDQATSFAKDESEAALFTLEPLKGSIVSFIPGIADLQLRFSEHLREKCDYERDFHYRGYGFERLARDIRGEVDIMEVYLSQGRQKRAICAMIDRFLDTVSVEEHAIPTSYNDLSFLADHDGEIWVTGPCRKTALDHSLTMSAVSPNF